MERENFKLGFEFIYNFALSQIARCVAMVASVSPNCTSTADNSDRSSSLSLQAIAFAAAVIEAVSSHVFIFIVPFRYILCRNKQKDSFDDTAGQENM